MLLDIFTSKQNIYLELLTLLIALPALLFSLSCHEFAHGFAAYKQGDHLAKSMGRLTLNPFRHIDPIGALAMLVFGFGWAKPVPVNPLNFKNGKKSTIIVSLAGICANLILAFISAFFMYFISYVIPYPANSKILITILGVITQALYYMVVLNCTLAAFNILPVPPLDGFKTVREIFETPKNMNFFISLERYQTYILLGLVLIISRTGIISSISGAVSNVIFKIMNIIFTAFI